jgi:hypothetical protein
MDDDEILAEINRLADKEHALERNSDDGLSAEDQEQLRQIGVQLDRYWDLLRQRRAHRAAGRDPDEAQLREADTVESYRQ